MKRFLQGLIAGLIAITTVAAFATWPSWSTRRSGVGDALTTGTLGQFAATTSAQLAGVISDETGSGALVFGTAPQLSTVELGHASDTTLARSAAGVITVEGVTVTRTIASGAKALATSAIASAACSSAQTDTATGTATTDTILATFNGDPTAVTGYVPLTTGMLTIIPYPTADTVNFKVCNNTSASITPGAITLNWKVLR